MDFNRHKMLLLATAKIPRPSNAILLLHANDSATDETGTYSPSWSGTAAYATGKFGKAFDASSGNYVTIGARISWLTNQNLQMEGWFKFDSIPINDFAGLCGLWGTSGGTTYGYGIKLYGSAAKPLYFEIYKDDSQVLNLVANTSITTNTWTHIAVSRSSNTWRLFVDGSQVASTNNSVGFDDISSGANLIGSYRGYSMDGKVDEFLFLKGTATRTSNFTPPANPYA